MYLMIKLYDEYFYWLLWFDYFQCWKLNNASYILLYVYVDRTMPMDKINMYRYIDDIALHHNHKQPIGWVIATAQVMMMCYPLISNTSYMSDFF
ncbi:hypothetical protein BDC45DRAFT_513400 [Circinella umbellata]|nr:hypothetical protein BDC45DRAFT_513400 [Circinella umbellata]